ncbi:SSI family serine proteinase inhibitor [Amycolatopsis echigonensis]|uniref:Protease n=1 Tax=Amycolatopsis echigonensis TaxID=2576905 RepID=A0A8E1VY86_9PSEU|nr:SSI family serine proteinase inhibitor [Amycolatopsis echigonensis]MBB2500374.1 protease [Amycolatopsis echigonensis]
MVFSSFAPVAAALIGFGGLAAPHVPESMLQLTMHETSGRVTSASLTCEPTGGTHRHRDAACATLEAVNGDFSRISPRRQKCTMIYSPVDVTAQGSWRGTPVTYRATYPNKCAADSQSNGVFAL